MEDRDELLALIGQRVARRRASLGLSLDQVAALSDVSRAMVSRIERGEVHASAVVLDRLCAGLGLTLSELFARETPSPLLRRAEQPVWRDPFSHYLRREVAPARSGSPVRIVEIEFPPSTEVTFAAYPERISEQHVLMLEGELEIATAGTAYTLREGDCLHMRVADGNGFRNRGSRTARYLITLVREPSP